MKDSISEQIRNNLDCEDILNCLFNLNELDKKCYEILHEHNESLTIKQIANLLDRDQSTINRSVSNLEEASLITKEKETYSKGGYSYIYTVKDSCEISENMRDIVQEWNNMVESVIDEFEEKY